MKLRRGTRVFFTDNVNSRLWATQHVESFLEKIIEPLQGWLSWLECGPMHLKVTGSIPNWVHLGGS